MGHISRSCSFSGELYVMHRDSKYSIKSAKYGSNLCISNDQQRPYLDHQQSADERTKASTDNLIANRSWPNENFHHLRYVVVFLCGLNMSLMLFARLGITVAIIDMVNQTETQTIRLFNNDTGRYETEIVESYMFDWDNTIQFFIISVYMVGYGIPQIPISIMVERKGGYVIGLITAVIALLAMTAIPLVAHLGWEYVALLRLIIGASHSSTMTINVRMVEVWMPAGETSVGVTMIQFLGCIGIVLNPIISGYLTANHWSMAFYGPCLVIFLWLVLWLIIVRDYPEDCCLISKQELIMILEKRNHQLKGNDQDDDLIRGSDGQVIENPWRKIFKLPCIYAFFFLWFCVCSSSSSFIFILPNFLDSITHVDIAENGTIIFIIQSGALFSYLWGLRLLSCLLNNDLSKTNARRIVYSISVLVSCIAWVLPAIVDSSPIWMCLLNRAAHPVVEIIFIGTILDKFGGIGMSASIFGLVNTVGNVSSFPSTILVGMILDEWGSSLFCWHAIFIGFASLNLVALTLYFIGINSEPVSLEESSNKKATLE